MIPYLFTRQFWQSSRFPHVYISVLGIFRVISGSAGSSVEQLTLMLMFPFRSKRQKIEDFPHLRMVNNMARRSRRERRELSKLRRQLELAHDECQDVLDDTAAFLNLNQKWRAEVDAIKMQYRVIMLFRTALIATLVSAIFLHFVHKTLFAVCEEDEATR
jgi:hypothetical protein